MINDDSDNLIQIGYFVELLAAANQTLAKWKCKYVDVHFLSCLIVRVLV